LDEYIVQVKMQLEWYFGDANYDKDEYLHEILDVDGYVDISTILDFNIMKNMGASEGDVRSS
jgi:hypothetical protein